ncbi:MAG: polysaccharide deacetylase family protein [Clostridia bacterium]|nr:polysaccharide deacetylase family protein [Clostridia bacterium]
MKHLASWAVMAILLFPACALAITYHAGDPSQERIAITVDDCENSTILSEMLDLFQEQEIHATFFVLGRALRMEDRDLWRRVLADGHEIGNHTFGHLCLTAGGVTSRMVKSQLRRTEDMLNQVLGFEYPMYLLRPPYGKCQINGAKTRIKNAGYEHIILWSVSQIDPRKALEKIQNGSVCLYHSNTKDLHCLKEIIPRLKEAGYEMVTVSDLFGFSGKEE